MSTSMNDEIIGAANEVMRAAFMVTGALARVIWWLIRHPDFVFLLGTVGATWLFGGPAGAIILVIGLAVAGAAWRIGEPQSFRNSITGPLRSGLRGWWHYRTHWEATMRQASLTVKVPDKHLIPRLGRVWCARGFDVVPVGLVPGQSPEDFERAAVVLAHAFGARECRVVVEGPGKISLRFATGDALRTRVEPISPDRHADPACIPIGLREDGEIWSLQLTGTHVLVAGVTGSGKGSVIWSILWAIGGPIKDGSVAVRAIDPKGGMELGMGAKLFARLEVDAEGAAHMLEEAVALMKQRAARLAGHTRQHFANPREPMILVVIDEVANLTAYLPDRKLRERITQALALLLTQGRAVGVNVVAALQDPRKEVLGLRNLFPTKIGLRLDEPAQIDMVLGDGARAAGARCDEISPRAPGVGFVRVDGQREPVRVRASFISDQSIRRLVEAVGSVPSGGLAPVADAEAA